jgi:signal transduction histidine kinase/ActR/RegA family two-component response regulator
MVTRYFIARGPTVQRCAVLFAIGFASCASAWAGEPVASARVTPITQIVYGGDAHFPPYEFLDQEGQPAGLNVDLIRAVGRAQGLDVRIELRSWKEIRAGLQNGQIDVAAMYRSPRRAREVDFAIPHELVYHEMFIRRGTPALNSLAHLKGRRVLVEKDTFAEDALMEMGYDRELQSVTSEPEALSVLAAGGGDVAIVTQTPGRPFQERLALADKITATGPPVLLAEYAFVTCKGRRDLVEILNQGVAAVKADGQYDRIFNHWIRPDLSARLARQIGWAVVVTLAVFFAGAGWNYSLRRRVARQTEALRREFQEKEQAQAALAESERFLRQSQKMEAVGCMAGGIAHDFNNILTIILNYGYFVRAELVAENLATASADEILAATERAGRLTKQLLAFSRAMPMKIELLDLCEVTQEMNTMIQRLVGEHICMELVVASEPVVVEADLVDIEQMLLNLAANARDAMPDGGKLTLTIAGRTLPAGNPLSLAAGDYAAVVVADNGLGMSSEMLEKIFDPFFTTKQVGHGTGLGLAIVFANVTKLGGKVTVTSAPAQGATFTLLLPRRHAVRSNPALSNRVEGIATGGRRQTVLLVEDDEALRHAARLALEQAGYQIIEAGDGMEALKVAAQNNLISIVVTDVVMPRRSGPQLVAELRARIPELCVLYVSGYVQKSEKIDVSPPHTAFLAKPYSPKDLVAAVQALSSAGSQ